VLASDNLFLLIQSLWVLEQNTKVGVLLNIKANASDSDRGKQDSHRGIHVVDLSLDLVSGSLRSAALESPMQILQMCVVNQYLLNQLLGNRIQEPDDHLFVSKNRMLSKHRKEDVNLRAELENDVENLIVGHLGSVYALLGIAVQSS
jgi:hypothetical protein